MTKFPFLLGGKFFLRKHSPLLEDPHETVLSGDSTRNRYVYPKKAGLLLSYGCSESRHFFFFSPLAVRKLPAKFVINEQDPIPALHLVSYAYFLFIQTSRSWVFCCGFWALGLVCFDVCKQFPATTNSSSDFWLPLGPQPCPSLV